MGNGRANTDLASQQPFVVDNTNPTAAARQRYLQLARAAGFSCDLIFFDCAMEAALERNALRTGKARVPDVAIKGTLAKLERPTTAERFDRVLVGYPLRFSK